MSNWNKIKQLVDASKDFILTDEERILMQNAEQNAYERNLTEIKEILDLTEKRLNNLGFWVENQLSDEGMRFRFSLTGYYGPGGFSP